MHRDPEPRPDGEADETQSGGGEGTQSDETQSIDPPASDA